MTEHRYEEGMVFILREDYPPLGLEAGTKGTVWGFFATVPPAYEVTFCTPEGKEFDALIYENELEFPFQLVETNTPKTSTDPIE